MKIICCNRMEIIRLDGRADLQIYMREAPMSAFFCPLSSKLWAFELGFMTQEFLMTAEKHSLITLWYKTGQEKHKDPLKQVYSN